MSRTIEPLSVATAATISPSYGRVDPLNMADAGMRVDGEDPDREPYAMLQWSDDGGYEWSKEHWRSMGKKGKRKVRLIWNSMGMSRDRLYRLSISEPVKVVLIAAFIDAEIEGK